MEWIDSHCHLRKFKQRGELEATLKRAAEAGVTRMITVGTSLEDWVTYREMHAAKPNQIYYTVGLHPCYVDEDWESATSQIAPFFMPPNPPVALGEIGLDYFHLPKDPVRAGEVMLMQEEAFRQQLLLASELDIPVIIHSREAFEDSVRMIDESGVNWAHIVFHCFTYGAEEVAQINARGGSASFTGIATYKSAGKVREAVREQGIDRFMVETDCPYLTPEPHRGDTNEPAYIPLIGQRCADALAVNVEELAAQATQNTLRFFNLD